MSFRYRALDAKVEYWARERRKAMNSRWPSSSGAPVSAVNAVTNSGPAKRNRYKDADRKFRRLMHLQSRARKQQPALRARSRVPRPRVRPVSEYAALFEGVT